MRRLAILALVLLLATGCASTGRNFSFEDANRVQIGMTESEVRQIMGEPTNKHVERTGELWMWIHVTGGLGGFNSKGFSVKFQYGRVIYIQK